VRKEIYLYKVYAPYSYAKFGTFYCATRYCLRVEGRAGWRLCDWDVGALWPDSPGSKRDARRVALRLFHRYLLTTTQQEVQGSTSAASPTEGPYAQTAC